MPICEGVLQILPPPKHFQSVFDTWKQRKNLKKTKLNPENELTHFWTMLFLFHTHASEKVWWRNRWIVEIFFLQKIHFGSSNLSTSSEFFFFVHFGSSNFFSNEFKIFFSRKLVGPSFNFFVFSWIFFLIFYLWQILKFLAKTLPVWVVSPKFSDKSINCSTFFKFNCPKSFAMKNRVFSCETCLKQHNVG